MATHSVVSSIPWGPWVLFGRAVQVKRGDGLEEWNEQGVVHEFVEDSACLVELRGMGRRRAAGETEKMVSHPSGEVDFSGSAGNNVDLHKLLP